MMEGKAGHLADVVWYHLVPPSYSLSLEASLFRPANGSFTSAGHLSTHTSILLLVLRQVPMLKPRLALNLWSSCLSLLNAGIAVVYHPAQILPFGCVLFSFLKYPLKNIGQAHRRAAARGSTLLQRSVLGSYSKTAFPFSFSMLHLGHSCDAWLPIPLSTPHGWNPGLLLHQLFAIDFLACVLKLPDTTLSLNLRTFLLTQCYLIQRREMCTPSCLISLFEISFKGRKSIWIQCILLRPPQRRGDITEHSSEHIACFISLHFLVCFKDSRRRSKKVVWPQVAPIQADWRANTIEQVDWPQP